MSQNEAASGSVDENTPLLAVSDAQKQHDLVYKRFSPSQKRLIVALVSWNGLLPLFVGGVFNVSIPELARDFDTTTDIVSLTISVSIVSAACGSLLGASHSTYYGRKPIYLLFLPVFIFGSFGVAFSRTVREMMFFRVIQAIGSSSGMSIGGASISDIYPLEQRGFAMGVFLAAVLLGPAVAPLAGGVAAYYSSWRTMQVILGLAGVVGLLSIIFLFPETSHPGTLGRDKARAAGKSGFTFVNPFKVLLVLKSPNILFVSITGLTTLLTDYVILVPLAETLQTKFGISNQAIIGLCFAPLGVGNIIGAPLAGYLSDRIVVTWREKRGSWYPEDRLRATLIGAAFLVPISTLAIGIIIDNIPGPLGLSLIMFGMFLNGIGVDTVLTPCGAYCVDILHHRSAEAMAATMAFRAGVIGIASSFLVPMVHSIGSGWTYAIVSLAAWFGALLMVLTIRYGQQLRDFNDIGYSTALTN